MKEAKRTCNHCGNKKLVGRFYFCSGVNPHEICAKCLVEHYIKIGVAQKIIRHIAKMNNIELQQKLF